MRGPHVLDDEVVVRACVRRFNRSHAHATPRGRAGSGEEWEHSSQRSGNFIESSKLDPKLNFWEFQVQFRELHWNSPNIHLQHTTHTEFMQEFHETCWDRSQILWILWNIKIFTLKASRMFILVQHGYVGTPSWNPARWSCRQQAIISVFAWT